MLKNTKPYDLEKRKGNVLIWSCSLHTNTPIFKSKIFRDLKNRIKRKNIQSKNQGPKQNVESKNGGTVAPTLQGSPSSLQGSC